MNKEFRDWITKENESYDLLKSNPRYKPQGCTKDFKMVIVGIIQGNIEDYHPCNFLNFQYFNSWQDAYAQLILNESRV